MIAVPMIELQRLTTEYNEHEDRIRIAGEVDNASAQVFWLTCRLLNRIIPHLTLWLERQHGNLPRADLFQSFAQQAAQQGLAPQAPVQAGPDSLPWVVQAVDIGTGTEHLQLTFKSSAGNAASVRFSAQALRQWLGILHQAYAAAQWPLAIWPEWMAGVAGKGTPSSVVLH